MGQINFLIILKDFLSKCNQNKRKTVATHTISLQLVASYSHNKCLPSLLVFLSSPVLFILTHYICSHTKTMSKKFRKISRSSNSRFGSSEKDPYFLKIPKWQHKLVRDYKQGKLLSYFLNNAAKTCLYGLKISENIEIEHVFEHFISLGISTQVASAPLMELLYAGILFCVGNH